MIDRRTAGVLGYYADYDWVAFCQLFDRMIDLPKDFPKLPEQLEFGDQQFP